MSKKIVEVMTSTVSAKDVKKPEIKRPEPDYWKYYRMSDEELMSYVRQMIEDYMMRAERGYYTVSVSDLIMLELVRRELERSEKNTVKPYPTGQDFNISLTSGGDGDA